ncbi:MAG: 50S ribosomal protein L25 [bacterium]
MEELNLAVEERKIGTQGEINKLRRDGFIPGIIYGQDKPSLPMYLSKREFLGFLHKGKSPLFSLTIKGKKEYAIVKEKQINPLKNEIIHIDFMRVGLKEKIEIKVEIRAIGTPQGVKEGGVLEQLVYELNIKCPAQSIPEAIDVNVEGLKIGDMLHIKDLKEYEEIEILEDKEKIIFSVIPPKVEAEAEVKEELAEPEVIKKGKKEEEEVSEE